MSGVLVRFKTGRYLDERLKDGRRKDKRLEDKRLEDGRCKDKRLAGHFVPITIGRDAGAGCIEK